MGNLNTQAPCSIGKESEKLRDAPIICDTCSNNIEGVYASFGGNVVPYVEPKYYHLGCIPKITTVSA